MSDDITTKLQAFFPSTAICWMVDSKSPDLRQARAVPYLQKHAIQKRLDDAVGPGGWKAEYRQGVIPNSVACVLSIKLDGEWVAKEDVGFIEGADAEQESGSLQHKGAYASAFKRAAAAWGVGRYLSEYRPRYQELDPESKFVEQPRLPVELLPAGDAGADESTVRAAAAKALPPQQPPVVQAGTSVANRATAPEKAPEAPASAVAAEPAQTAEEPAAPPQEVQADASDGAIRSKEQLLDATPATERAYVEQLLSYIDSKQNLPVVISSLERGRGNARLKGCPAVLDYLLTRAKSVSTESIPA